MLNVDRQNTWTSVHTLEYFVDAEDECVNTWNRNAFFRVENLKILATTLDAIHVTAALNQLAWPRHIEPSHALSLEAFKSDMSLIEDNSRETTGRLLFEHDINCIDIEAPGPI